MVETMEIIPEYQSGAIGASPKINDGKPTTLIPMKKFTKECGHCHAVIEYTFNMTSERSAGSRRLGQQYKRGLDCPECSMFIRHTTN